MAFSYVSSSPESSRTVYFTQLEACCRGGLSFAGMENLARSPQYMDALYKYIIFLELAEWKGKISRQKTSAISELALSLH